MACGFKKRQLDASSAEEQRIQNQQISHKTSARTGERIIKQNGHRISLHALFASPRKTVWESGGADSVRTAALLSRSCQVSVKKQKNKIKIDSEIVNNLPAKELINEFSALKAFFGISCATWIKTPSDKELKTKFETFFIISCTETGTGVKFLDISQSRVGSSCPVGERKGHYVGSRSGVGILSVCADAIQIICCSFEWQ